MDNQETIKTNYLEVTQPIGTYYICSMTWQQLLEIAYADIREIRKKSESDEFDNYLGIQRTVSPNRIKEISDYVTYMDATFPTSIILHIKSEVKSLNGKIVEVYDDQLIEENAENIIDITNIQINNDVLEIRKDEKVAKILDGQHRIEGFRVAKEKGADIERFDFNVTIFVDLDLDDQAQIFSVINKAQTKVNKSLVYDLYSYAKHRSPQKTAHDIVRTLNKSEKSPFYKSIKVLGKAMDKEMETIAQATLAELVIDSISKEPMKDRNTLRKRSILGIGGLKKDTDEKSIQRRIFRNLFIDNNDEIIYHIINNYFTAVCNKWNRAWNNEPAIEKNIIKKSTGIIALFRFLRYLYNEMDKVAEKVAVSEFETELDKIAIEDIKFTTDEFKPGSSGQSELYRLLIFEYEKSS